MTLCMSHNWHQHSVERGWHWKNVENRVKAKNVIYMKWNCNFSHILWKRWRKCHRFAGSQRKNELKFHLVKCASKLKCHSFSHCWVTYAEVKYLRWIILMVGFLMAMIVSNSRRVLDCSDRSVILFNFANKYICVANEMNGDWNWLFWNWMAWNIFENESTMPEALSSAY